MMTSDSCGRRPPRLYRKLLVRSTSLSGASLLALLLGGCIPFVPFI